MVREAIVIRKEHLHMNKATIRKGIKWLLDVLHQNHYTTANISYLQPNQRLMGKKIIVTGGGRGLGYAMAKKFISEGASVLISGRNEETLKKVSQEIGCKYITFDVSEFSKIDEFLTKADTLLGGADCLVNNAGISLHEGNIFNVTEDGYDKQFDINLKGGYFLTKAFLKKYIENNRRNGSVLFLSSERGQYVDDIPYGLIKAAINSLTQGLSKITIRNSIRINAVAPGVTVSDMTGRTADNLYTEKYSTGRFYLPEEVAEIACFLLSDASACLSGQILVCNNGDSLNSYKY